VPSEEQMAQVNRQKKTDEAGEPQAVAKNRAHVFAQQAIYRQHSQY